jgi:hypothetical protein
LLIAQSSDRENLMKHPVMVLMRRRITAEGTNPALPGVLIELVF